MVELPDRASGSGNRLTPHVDFGLNGLGFLFRASGPKMGLTSSPWQEYGGLSVSWVNVSWESATTWRAAWSAT